MKEPQVTVGIMSERQIRFVFNGTYLANGVPVSGEHEAHTDGKQIFWNGNRYTRIVFTPEKEDYSFCLKEVTIGVKFHWERKEDQTFKGNLNLIVENGLITAINALSVEDYLLSVISSEMSATASLELLKSHAVISRSWLLAQIRKNKELAGQRTDSLVWPGRPYQLRRMCRRSLSTLSRHHSGLYRSCRTSHTSYARRSSHIRWQNMRCPLFKMLRRRRGRIFLLLGKYKSPLPDGSTGRQK